MGMCWLVLYAWIGPARLPQRKTQRSWEVETLRSAAFLLRLTCMHARMGGLQPLYRHICLCFVVRISVLSPLSPAVYLAPDLAELGQQGELL